MTNNSTPGDSSSESSPDAGGRADGSSGAERAGEAVTGPGGIVSCFIDYVAARGKLPHSVRQFAAEAGVEEDAVYPTYPSVGSLRSAANRSFLEGTLIALKEDSRYSEYSGPEKLLAFFFTLLEALSRHRSYVMAVSSAVPGPHCPFLKSLREPFRNYAIELLEEWEASGELPRRPFGHRVYEEVLWGAWVFLLAFWRRDTSKGFERSDAAVEKTVTLVIDLIARGPLDSGFDLFRFLASGLKLPGIGRAS